MGMKRLGVAVSGGADSVACLLAPICKKTRSSLLFSIWIMGCVKRLRRDATWVKALAKKAGATCR